LKISTLFFEEKRNRKNQMPKRSAAAAAAPAAPEPVSNFTRLIFKEGMSSKFWQITIEDSTTTTQYGKIGSDGATGVKQHADAEKAKVFAAKEIIGKQKKGYVIEAADAAEEKSSQADVPVVVEAPAEKEEEVAEKPAKKPKRGAKAAVKEAEDPAPAPSSVSSSSTAAAGPAATYLTFEEGNSSKFWKITTEDSKTTVKYGKIGSDGVTTVKEHANAAKAKAFADKEVAGKKKKGYVESSTD
jgi:predicted DNA-binding WGR domain protein